MADPSPAPKVVGYFTDVEGNWEYFLRCLSLSSVLQWADASQTELVLKDDCYFVFGGDAGDKRDGTIRFVTLMIKLKRRYPDRVFLIVGNRDANKLRFLSELTEHDLHAGIPPLPPGVTGAPKDCLQYLKELAVQQGAAESADQVSDATVAVLNTMANRLRWILDCTMGSAGDFEFRRRELALLSGTSAGDVSDDDVVASFYNSVAQPDGFMRQYVLLGQLAVVIDATLYVHGGVYGVFDPAAGIQNCAGLVPVGDDLTNQISVPDRDEWVAQLNRWLSEQVAAIVARPAYTPDRSARAGQALFMYGAYCPTPSVIMARMLDDSSMPLAVPQATADILASWGISRVVCGHTPHGNAPTVFSSRGIQVHLVKRGAAARAAAALTPALLPSRQRCCPHASAAALTPALQVVMADTSFSDLSSKARPTDNRGAAASEVLVCGPVLQVHGALQDGVPVHFVTVTDRERFPPSTPIFMRSLSAATPLQDIRGDAHIGAATQDGFFVKSATADGRYSLCKVSGRDYAYKYVAAEELPSLL